MGKGGTVLGIIGIILAAGAIAFTFIVWNGQNTIKNTKVVGIWNALDENLDYTPFDSQNSWLFEFRDSPFNNTNYISVSRANTRITLLKAGWYQIHINVLLEGIDPSSAYWVRLYESGLVGDYFDRHQTSASPESTYHYIDSSLLVNSNGTKYIEINGVSSGDDFEIYSTYQTLNQITIEYIAT